jgi:hypothetical protein
MSYDSHYKVKNLIGDTYQVYYYWWGGAEWNEVYEYQGSLADCEAYIRLEYVIVKQLHLDVRVRFIKRRKILLSLTRKRTARKQ